MLPCVANAATYYWAGTPGGVTSNPNNWTTGNPTNCSGGGAGTPTTGDTVIFDPDCDNGATINQALTVDGLTVQAGYTGTITQNQTATVGNLHMVIAGGTWVGTANNITVNGNFTISGGTFTAPSTTMSVSGDFTNSGETFTATLGTVALTGTNQTITGSTTF